MQRPVLVMCLVMLTAAASGSRLPIAARELASITATAVVPIDVDLDGTDELYCLASDRHTIRDQRGVIRWRSEDTVPEPAAGSPWLVADVTGDGTPEVIIAAGTADSLGSSYVYWLDLRTRRLRLCPVSGPAPDAGSRWSVRAMVAADLNTDGVNELLVGMSPGRRNRPAAVSALDCRAGARLWSAPVTPGVSRLSAEDIDEDGFPEVLVGAMPAGDSTAHLVCLGHDGQERWQYRAAAAPGVRELAVGVAHTRRERLAVPVLLDHSGSVGADPDVLQVLNGADGRAIVRSPRIHRARWEQLAVGDLDADDMPEVVTADSRGGIEVRDISLKPLRATILDDMIDSLGVVAIPGISGRQLLAVQERAITILDHRLRVIGRAACASQVTGVVPLRAGPRKPIRLLVRDAEPDAAGLATFRIEELILRPRPFPWLPALVVVLAVLLGGAGIAAYTNAFYAAALRRLSRRTVESAGIAVLDRKGRIAPVDGRARMLLADYAHDDRLDIRGLEARPEFEPLRDALEAVRSGRMRTARCEVMLLVDRMPRAYRVTVSASMFGSCLLAFEDLAAVEYVRHIREWGPVAQRMAHGIKNPLTAMSLILQRMERDCPPSAKEPVASMMEEIDRLRRMADGFMRFVKLEPPRLVREDLNAVIRGCLDKPGSVRPDGITVECALRDLPLVPLDRAQLCAALDNLIGNAVAAMGEHGTLRVSTELPKTRRPAERRRVAIKIQDTGRGIPIRYLERLFEPYFSLRPGGTGLGMCIAKRIVDDHNGTIAVESTEGVGTTVTIMLPVDRA